MKFSEIRADLFQWTDTCNSYVLRNGSSGVLIDLGDGSVLDGLESIGVKSLDWVLFTHHHREQCQGAATLAEWRKRGTKVATSTIERPFFEKPASVRPIRPRLGDPFTVYGASYLRPPIAPVQIDHSFAKMDNLCWRDHEFWCVETAGNSRGHMSYLLKEGHDWIVFSGDLMCDNARMHTWFDTEWDYGLGTGIYELAKSAAQIAGYDPALLLPSHGAVISNARQQLNEYVRKLRQLAALYVRGWDFQRFDGCDQDTISRPSSVPHLWQVTPHLYKFRGPNCWVNFAMLLADSGHALLVDCGLFEPGFLDTAITRMQERLGLKKIDAVFVTHIHGDHSMDSNHIRDKYGAELWTMEGIANIYEHPWDYDLCALLPFYTNKEKTFGPLQFDRVIRDGEVLTWEGYTLCVDWMPGQTKHHACLHGEIDGRRVAFTGDNIFASTTDVRQSGTEAVFARNDSLLEEGYIYAAEYLHTINPDLIMGAHCWVLDRPEQLIERYRARAIALRSAFQDLSIDADYRYMFDPYWVKAMPYRLTLERGGAVALQVLVRNFSDRPSAYSVAIHCPESLSVEPAVIHATIPPSATISFPVKLRVTADAPEGVHILAIDVTRGEKRYGELFDFIAHVGRLDHG